MLDHKGTHGNNRFSMASDIHNRFSGPVRVFHGRVLSERATPAGYVALIDAYKLAVPLPRTASATSEHHRGREAGGWRILTARHAPPSPLEGHLAFGLN
jgi:hypothetical protein